MNATEQRLRAALEAAKEHLEYCNYGDNWERERAQASGLAEQIDQALAGPYPDGPTEIGVDS